MQNEENRTRLTPKQRKFIKAFSSKCACNISATCAALGIGRTTFYVWMNGNPKFKQEIENEQERLIDFAETKLQQNIAEGKESSIFFFLKTKGKKRGYIETVENNVQVNAFEKLLESIPDEDQ